MAEVVVAFTVSGQREKYLRAALDSWTKVRGIQEARLVFCVEPVPVFPFDNFAEWAARVFREPLVVRNTRVQGVVRNTRQAFDVAFGLGARLAVVAEEDLLVSAGVLEYLTWAMAEYEQDQEVAAICAHVKDSQCGDAAVVTRAAWFNPLVCATWKDRWEGLLRPAWGSWRAGPPGNTAWDSNLREVVARAGKSSIFPVRSRVLHIGEVSTTYGAALSEFMYRDSVSGCFAADHQVTRFREVPFARVPGLRV